jgi:hypothetical protein
MIECADCGCFEYEMEGQLQQDETGPCHAGGYSQAKHFLRTLNKVLKAHPAVEFEHEERLERAYKLVCTVHSKRKKSLRMKYIIYKIAQLRGWTELAAICDPFEAPSHFKRADLEWKHICTALEWEWLPSTSHL